LLLIKVARAASSHVFAVAFKTLKSLDPASRMQDLSHLSGARAALRFVPAHAPRSLLKVWRSGSDSDISEALSAFDGALAQVLSEELHKHAISEAHKGIILPAQPPFLLH